MISYFASIEWSSHSHEISAKVLVNGFDIFLIIVQALFASLAGTYLEASILDLVLHEVRWEEKQILYKILPASNDLHAFFFKKNNALDIHIFQRQLNRAVVTGATQPNPTQNTMQGNPFEKLEKQ